MARDNGAIIKKAVGYLVKELKKEGFTILKYEAYSSNSVYLKLDEGAAGTIRVSDHHGKKHLKYKYNLILGEKEMKKVMDGDVERFYFPMRLIEMVVLKANFDRKQKLERWGKDAYTDLRAKNKVEGETKKGFWQGAVYV